MHCSEQLPFIKSIAYFSSGAKLIWAAALHYYNCLLCSRTCIDLCSCLSLRQFLTFLKDTCRSEQLPFINRMAYFPDGAAFIWAAAFHQGNYVLLLRKCIDLSSCLSLRKLLTYLKDIYWSEQLPGIKNIVYFSKRNVLIWATAFH